MIASALEVRKIYGENTHCVFIGPCIAKKVEARDPLLQRVVNEALTFVELRHIFTQKGINLDQMTPSKSDPPYAGIGCSFPLTGGLLISAGLEKDPLDNRFMVATGRKETDDALIDMEENRINLRLVEALMCHGCHAGPGTSRAGASHRQRALICAYAQKARQVQPETMDINDTERGFVADDQRLKEPNDEDIRNILTHTNKFSPEDELNCGACGYPTCRAKASAVFHELAEEAMCLPFLIEQAERVCNELHLPWKDFREIHRQLISTEKLASLGQLAAGIAHELNNPLGTILLYTGLIERKLGGESKVSGDIELVQKETQRCKRIVAGLLDFARQNRLRFTRSRMDTYIKEVVANSFNTDELSSKGVRLRLETGEDQIEADIDRDQLTQVLVNLIQNGIDAMGERGGEIVVSTGYSEGRNRVRITVRDTGCGIPKEDHDRVFQPFFTTKNIGRGTGLGLAITYGIVKIHQGTIWFESTPGTGTTFFIELPLAQAFQTGSAPLHG
jgi:signal transduction histidine kinase